MPIKTEEKWAKASPNLSNESERLAKPTEAKRSGDYWTEEQASDNEFRQRKQLVLGHQRAAEFQVSEQRFIRREEAQ